MKRVVWGLILVLTLSLIYVLSGSPDIIGADERVLESVEVYAQAAGIKQRPPFIDTDKGELLLFLFALGGAVSGFWIGYVWRGLFGNIAPRQSLSERRESE